MSVSLRAVAPGVRLSCEALEDRATPAAAYALSGASLLAFDTTDAGATTATAITGVGVNETLVGIDFRAADGLLYGLGVDASTDTATLYTISLETGAATAVGAPGAVAFTDATGARVDLPTTAAAGYGVSFDPSADRLRVVTSNGLNFRVDPSTGAPVDGDAGLSGSVNGTNPDGVINGLPVGSTGVGGTAYTNTGAPGGATTQYTLDAESNSLFIQGGSSGTQSAQVTVTLDGEPLDFTAVNGFDIPDTVAITESGELATGTAVAALTVDGATRLYEIDLATGAATDLGAAPQGTRGLVFNNTVPKAVEFASATFTATEAGRNAAITLTRTGDTSAPATVAVVVTGGTATEGSDFSGTSYVVTFAAGEATAVLNIPITDDHIAEPDETITLTLSAPSDGAVGAQSTATVTITDSGTVPPVQPIVVGTGPGAAVVNLLNPDGSLRSGFVPYAGGMSSGVKVATGDVNGDGVDDIITAPGQLSPHVKVFDGATGDELYSFYAFDPTFFGGITIAAGDVNGDGFDDIVVGAASGSSHVKVFSGADGSEMVSFFTAAGSTSGVNVAAGDVNGDGRADLITGAASGLTYVKAFDLTTGVTLQNFIAYQGFAGGVTVATGDVNGDGTIEIVTGTARAGSHVKVFNGRTGANTASYLAFAPAFSGGVNVATRDVNGDGIADVLVGGARGTDHTKIYSGLSGMQINSFLAFGAGFTGGVFIG